MAVDCVSALTLGFWMKYFALLLTSLLFVRANEAIVDVTVESGYVNSASKNTSLLSATGGDGSGYMVNGGIHYNFMAGGILRIGLGPDFAYGAQSLKFDNAPATANTQTTRRLGLDAYFLIEAVPIVKPFIRIRMGKEWLTNTQTGTTAGQASELITEYGSLYYDLLLGANYPILEIVSLYAQFGVTGGNLSQLTLKSYTLNGAAQSYVLSSQTVLYSGLLLNLGVMLSF